MLRQLAYREADGGHLKVELLWDPSSGGTAVRVEDEREGKTVFAHVPQAHCLRAFQHPFAWIEG